MDGCTIRLMEFFLKESQNKSQSSFLGKDLNWFLYESVLFHQICGELRNSLILTSVPRFIRLSTSTACLIIISLCFSNNADSFVNKLFLAVSCLNIFFCRTCNSALNPIGRPKTARDKYFLAKCLEFFLFSKS